MEEDAKRRMEQRKRVKALKAKEISEKMFMANDSKGAKKFASKAKNYYPELEGISQMLTTLEVYVAAEEGKLSSGGSNWYNVLGVSPHADEETIRKKYHKLALLLHPDKNKSVGAEGAFQLVCQAWSFLSDKIKKTAYDWSYSGKLQLNGQPSYGPSQPVKQNGFHDFTNTVSSNHTSKNPSSKKKNHTSVSHSSCREESSTFWTVCHQCKMHYEYLRMYVNHNLLCPNCHEAYFAVETGPPSNRRSKMVLPNGDAARNSYRHGDSGYARTNTSNHNNFEWAAYPKSSDALSASQSMNMVQQAYEKGKLEKQRANAASRKQEAYLRKNVPSKKRMLAESAGQLNASKRCRGTQELPSISDKMKSGANVGGTHCQTNHEENHALGLAAKSNCQVDIKQLLIQKALAEILVKLNTCMPTAAVRKVAVEDAPENTPESVVRNMDQDLFETKCDTQRHEINLDSSRLSPERKSVEQISVDVPCSDFHDFEINRRVESFGSHQVWAVYDDDDGMPRHYAMIHSVISLSPFTVKVHWLQSVTHSRISNASWYSNGFSRTCGEFRLLKHEIVNSVDCFSHNIRWTSRIVNDVIRIYPQKGDIWALYRNWSPEWNELTQDEVVHKYDFVEVLEDHDEELGVVVVPLVKVAGSKAIFHQHFDPAQIFRIPNEEISRFSHQVPSHIFTGEHGLKLLKGFRELDPAAVPSEILESTSNLGVPEFPDAFDTKELEHATTIDKVKVLNARTSNP